MEVYMNHRTVLVVVITAFLAMAFQPLAAQAADSEGQISSVREQWEKAWNAKDLKTLTAV
jgi:hypothetical protein